MQNYFLVTFKTTISRFLRIDLEPRNWESLFTPGIVKTSLPYIGPRGVVI